MTAMAARPVERTWPARRLTAVPEIRYCPRCEIPASPPARGRLPLAGRTAAR
jgi:hypothetical protein